MDVNHGNVSSKENLDKYMNIDEFMQVLREAELITPFGKLHKDPDVYSGDYGNVQRFTFQPERTNSCTTRKAVIPLTPVVVQVIDFERKLRDIDLNDLQESNNLLSCSPQNSKKILQDSELTNYLQLLIDKEETVR